MAETLRPGGAPVVVKFFESNDGDRKRGQFSHNLHVTYTMDDISFSLKLTEQGLMDRLHSVGLHLYEIVHGKGSAQLGIHVHADELYGAVSSMSSHFSGYFEVQKGKICFPPVPDTEYLSYGCPETKVQSHFFLDKKTNNEFVDSVTAAHCFSIKGGAVYYISIKIMSNKGTGLSVMVEGPIEHASGYEKKFFTKFGEKINRAAEMRSQHAIHSKLQYDSYGNTGNNNFKDLVNSRSMTRGFGNCSVFCNRNILAHHK